MVDNSVNNGYGNPSGTHGVVWVRSHLIYEPPATRKIINIKNGAGFAPSEARMVSRRLGFVVLHGCESSNLDSDSPHNVQQAHVYSEDELVAWHSGDH